LMALLFYIFTHLEEKVYGFTYSSKYFSNFSSVTQNMKYIFLGGQYTLVALLHCFTSATQYKHYILMCEQCSIFDAPLVRTLIFCGTFFIQHISF
jgi:hypothetical protein